MLRRSSKRFKASFTAEPHEAAMALPFLQELRDGFFDLHKDAFDAAYFAFLAGSSPVTSPQDLAVPQDVVAPLVAPHVTVVASVTPRHEHPKVMLDLQKGSSDEDDSDGEHS